MSRSENVREVHGRFVLEISRDASSILHRYSLYTLLVLLKFFLNNGLSNSAISRDRSQRRRVRHTIIADDPQARELVRQFPSGKNGKRKDTKLPPL